MPKQLDSRYCLFCQLKFMPKRKHQVYCCAEHRSEHFWLTHEVVEKSKLEALRQKAGVVEWI